MKRSSIGVTHLCNAELLPSSRPEGTASQDMQCYPPQEQWPCPAVAMPLLCLTQGTPQSLRASGKGRWDLGHTSFLQPSVHMSWMTSLVALAPSSSLSSSARCPCLDVSRSSLLLTPCTPDFRARHNQQHIVHGIPTAVSAWKEHVETT